MRSVAAALAALTALGLACRGPAPQPTFSAGDRAAITEDGLRRLDGTGFQAAWLRPGVALSDYDGVNVVLGGVAYRRPPRRSPRDTLGNANYALPDGIRDAFMAALNRRFREALADAGLLVGIPEAASRMLDIRLTLIDIEVNAPLEQFSAEDQAWIDTLGEVTVAIELFDGERGERLAVFAARNEIAPPSQRAMRARPGDAIYEVSRICETWAQQLRRVLDVLREAQLARRDPAGASKRSAPDSL